MTRRHAARLLLVGMLTISASVGLTGLGTGASTPTVEASVAYDDKDDDKGKSDQDEENDDDHTLNGQVIEINTLKNPPELIVGTVDGAAVVRVLKTDEIALNGVKIGDYVELTGEKLDELLFEATEISVDNSDN